MVLGVNFDCFVSFALLFGVILIPILTGFVFRFLFVEKGERYGFLLYPFLGLSVIILILQNLIYLNIPVKFTASPLFVLILVLFFILFFRGKFEIAKDWQWISFFVLLVVLINGVGYFRETARWYIGYGWQDQYNYTVTAEFLKEYPFSTDFENVDTPYIVQAIAKKNDRIGQSVYHAFLSSITGLSSDCTYGAISLLAPVLVFFSFLYLFDVLNVNGIIAYLFAYLASVIPATSVIHLENFLSQALGTPFLIVCIAFVIGCDVDSLSVKKTVAFAFLIAGLNSIYTEFTPFVLLIIVLKILFDLFSFRKLRTLFFFVLSLLFSVVLNPLYFMKMIRIFKRTGKKGVLSHVYPFSHSLYGYSRLLWGDLGIVEGNVCFFIFCVVFWFGQ